MWVQAGEGCGYYSDSESSSSSSDVIEEKYEQEETGWI